MADENDIIQFTAPITAVVTSPDNGNRSADANADLGFERDEADMDAAFQKHMEDSADTLNDEPLSVPAKQGDREVGAAAATPDDKKVETVAAAEDDFDKVKLPSHARPATGKQFEEVKAIGRRMVSEMNTKYATLQKEMEALKSKVPADGQTVDPETKEELEQLREFARLTDYQTSPAFKKQYDTPIDKQTESVFASMKSLGYNDEALARVKELGLKNINWTETTKDLDERAKAKFFRELDKLEGLEETRQGALDTAKTDKEAFLKQVAEAPDQEVVRTKTGLEGANNILNHNKLFDTLSLDKLPTGVSKEHAEALNAGSEDAKKFLEAYGTDASPQTFAELLAIGAAAQRYLKVNTYLKGHSDALTTKLADAEKRATEAESRLTKIKGAGAAPRTPTSPGGSNPSIGEEDDMDSRFRAFQGGQ